MIVLITASTTPSTIARTPSFVSFFRTPIIPNITASGPKTIGNTISESTANTMPTMLNFLPSGIFELCFFTSWFLTSCFTGLVFVFETAKSIIHQPVYIVLLKNKLCITRKKKLFLFIFI